MFYLDLFCASISKICPKRSEKPKRAHKDVTLDVIKLSDYGKGNKDIVHVLNLGSGNDKKKKKFHVN